MSSMQERLQLKRVPLDTWNIREQLCLASAVVRSGDQNWMSVSRALKTVGEPNRPQDWYSQKSCAAQYGALLENVETPKRKKRNSEGGVESPQESILKKLTQERIVEIQKTVAEMNQQYDQIKTEITEVRNPATSEDRLREVWSNIESSRRAKERESARVSAWVQEREERRARAERPWRPPAPTSPSNQVTLAPAPPSSPLLTSLLKSSPVVTTPQHISHPASVVESVSPSVTAPTLSMLLEKSAAATHHESKHAAIEHIKSQLVQIEHQLKANTPPPVPLAPTAAVPTTPAVDIDDIEIKAEDVYAFRDVDIHIQPVAAMHKGNNRVVDKPKKDEMDVDISSIPEPDAENQHVDVVKEEPIETVSEEVLTVETELAPEVPAPPEEPVVILEAPQVAEPPPEVEIKIAFPEVKFPTTEIKIIQPEVLKVKEEVREPEIPIPEPETFEVPFEVPLEEVPLPPVAPEPVVEEDYIPLPPEQPPPPEPVVEQPVEQPQPVEEQPVEVQLAPDPETIPLPPDPVPDEVKVSNEATPIPSEPEVVPEPVEIKLEVKEEVNEEEPPELDEDEDKTLDEIKKDEEAEDSIPLRAMVGEGEGEVVVEGGGGEGHPDVKPAHHLRRDDAHTETDDDTPMELSREEEKDGKKRRDYSRKKKSDSRTCSGSESAAEASAPESPSGTDAERQHRLWKKSVMLVYSRLCAHKYASVFLRPISDEEAPGYSCVVKRPMDLHTIRRNIDTGVIRTTSEFQRDVLLMLSNALMYNSSEHSVYSMAKDMHEEARCQLGMLVAAQAHAGLVAPPARRKRRRPDSPAAAAAAALDTHTHKRHTYTT